MQRITALTPDPRRPDRVAVEVDGRPTVTVSAECIYRLAVRVGQRYDEIADALVADAEAGRTYDRAVKLLASRARSVVELTRLLQRKGESESAVESTVRRLAAQGFLDDRSFARQFVRAKMVGSRLARRRVLLELARRGVDREVAERAVSEVKAEDAVDESSLIEEAARRKLRTLATVEPAVRRRRLYVYLARRGYGFDAIAGVLRVLDQSIADESSGAT